MGKMFNIRFGKIRFSFWRVTFYEKFLFFFYFLFLPLEDFGMDAVSVQWTIYHVRTEIR